MIFEISEGERRKGPLVLAMLSEQEQLIPHHGEAGQSEPGSQPRRAGERRIFRGENCRNEAPKQSAAMRLWPAKLGVHESHSDLPRHFVID